MGNKQRTDAEWSRFEAELRTSGAYRESWIGQMEQLSAEMHRVLAMLRNEFAGTVDTAVRRCEAVLHRANRKQERE